MNELIPPQPSDDLWSQHTWSRLSSARRRTLSRDVEFFEPAEAVAVQDILEHRIENVKAVAPDIHVTLLIAVVGRDRALHHPEFLQFELHQNLGVEVVVVRAEVKRNLP